MAIGLMLCCYNHGVYHLNEAKTPSSSSLPTSFNGASLL